MSKSQNKHQKHVTVCAPVLRRVSEDKSAGWRPTRPVIVSARQGVVKADAIADGPTTFAPAVGQRPYPQERVKENVCHVSVSTM